MPEKGVPEPYHTRPGLERAGSFTLRRDTHGDIPPIETNLPTLALINERDRHTDRKRKGLCRADQLELMQAEIQAEAWVSGIPLPRSPQDAASRMRNCATYLWLRQERSSKITLKGSNFCCQTTICPGCQHGRQLALLRRYGPRLEPFSTEKHGMYLATLTWPSVAADRDLKACVKTGFEAWAKLWARRKARGTGPLRKVLGAAISLEITWGPAGWHPHLHGVLVCPPGIQNRVEVEELRPEWDALTGGGRQLHLDYLPPGESQRKGICEAFKYCVKTEASLSKRARSRGEKPMPPMPTYSGSVGRLFMGASIVFGMRRVRSYGCLYSPLDDSEPELIAEEAEPVSEYTDWLLRWAGLWYEMEELKGVEA